MIWWRMGVMWWIKYWIKLDRKVRVGGSTRSGRTKFCGTGHCGRIRWTVHILTQGRTYSGIQNIAWSNLRMPTIGKEQLLADLQAALYCAKVASYAQGMGIIEAASTKHGWNADLSLCAMGWRAGCIIRAQLLTKIKNAYTINPTLPNLMIDPTFAAELNERQLA
jgi:6-phosphogluconate dehydrogenase